MTINIIFIVALIVLAIVGSALGFGRALKISTSGISGIIISIIVCVLIGGALLATPAISNLVYNGNNYFRDIWVFFGIIRLAHVIYFIALFAIVQIIRIIIVRIIKGISEIDKKAIKIVNRILGAIYVALAAFVIMLLLFAALSLIEQTGFAQSILEAIDGTFLRTLYNNNPIVFGSNLSGHYPTYPPELSVCDGYCCA